MTCSRYSRSPQSNWTGWNIQPQIYITHERQLRISTSSHQHTGQNNTKRHLMSSMPTNLSVCNDLEHYGNNGKGVYFWLDDDNNMGNISQPYKSEWACCKPATPYLSKEDREEVPHVRHTRQDTPNFHLRTPLESFTLCVQCKWVKLIQWWLWKRVKSN